MKGKIQFKKVPCKRCGTTLLVRVDSITGCDTLKEELGGICYRCITPEEYHEINKAVLVATRNKLLDKQYDT